jgi:signal transduction histidine kinase
LPLGPPAVPPRHAAGSGNVSAGFRLKLPQKTTGILLVLLVAVVAAVGAVFSLSTQSMLQAAEASQVNAFAYAMATTLGNMDSSNRNMIQIQFDALDKTPNLEFVVLTDARGRQKAGLVADKSAWAAYTRQLEGPQARAPNQLGQVQAVRHDNRYSHAVTVPVFERAVNGSPTQLAGYLHAGFGTESTAAQFRILQAFVLFTCMGVVLLAVPVAGVTARHITVPIQTLAHAAHALADGDLSHRVEIARHDELGELADAFNRMADTVQGQQEHIRRINTGLEQKVHERTAELEKVNARLQAEIAEKEDFLRAVSHDLNAPLRNIAGMASMLAMKYQDTLEKDALQRLDRIQKNVQIECELINELLELSRIKSRREKIERVDLHELVTGVAEGFSSDLETRGIVLRIVSHLPVMRCERIRMRQMFQNLIDNGIKYMRPDGPREIAISFRWDDGEGVFAVKDTGMGIARDDLPHLFHVFRRAKNAAVMKVPGKGVGLAYAKSIVENYSGRMWAESVEGQGTTFLFAIPRSHFEIPHEVAA